jgi:hypothetical protein
MSEKAPKWFPLAPTQLERILERYKRKVHSELMVERVIHRGYKLSVVKPKGEPPENPIRQ